MHAFGPLPNACMRFDVPAWLLKTVLFLVRYVAPAALLAIAIFQIHE